MKRWLVIVCVLLVGAAAPARAWCEATCIAPTPQGQPHCPTHDPVDGTTAISATVVDDCPVLESARPAASARLDADAALISTCVPAARAQHFVSASFAHRHCATTVFQRSIPLRI